MVLKKDIKKFIGYNNVKTFIFEISALVLVMFIWVNNDCNNLFWSNKKSGKCLKIKGNNEKIMTTNLFDKETWEIPMKKKKL